MIGWKAVELATIRDVADAAGVSLTTVSHVVNGRGRIARETRERVLKVAAELGYRANAHAQQLVTRRSRILAIQMPTLHSGDADVTAVPNSEFFLELINGAAAAAESHQYVLIVLPSGVDATNMSDFGIDGAIVVDPSGEEHVLGACLASGRPVVTVGVPVKDIRTTAVVDNDHRTAAVKVMEHFVSHGYRDPVVVVDDTTRSYIRDAIAGYTDWAERNGSTPRVYRAPSTKKSAMRDLVAKLCSGSDAVDAVYAVSEDIALGVLHAAGDRGVRVPESLAVASAVDSRLLRLARPQITGVNLYPRRIGQVAVDALASLIEDGDGGTRLERIPTRLVPRGSSRRPSGTPTGGRRRAASGQPR